MFPFFNATGWERKAKAAGKEYVFAPFSESKEIYNLDYVEHISNAYGYLGLVGLNYDENQEKLYGSYAEYKKAREIKALVACLKHAENVLAFETNAKEACEKAPNAVHELRTFDVKKLKNNVTMISQWLRDAGYDDQIQKETAAEVVAKRPDWSKKDEPRPVESTD